MMATAYGLTAQTSRRCEMGRWMIAFFALAATTTAARTQDVAAGQNSFALCTICHSVGEGAQNKLGPILNGLDGRRSGSVEGYDYSPALKNAGIVWSEATFKEFKIGRAHV